MWDWEQNRRVKILTGIITGAILILVVRLAWMQIWQGPQYRKIAEQNRIRQFFDQAPRGSFYDRNGTVMVSNRPSFAVSIIPYEYIDSGSETPVVAEICGLTVGEIDAMLAKTKDFPFTPVRIKRDVDAQTMTRIEERKAYLPGVTIEAVPVRSYLYQQLAAQVFGYVGDISEEEYNAGKEQGYRPQDLVGKDGLERIWEATLRGTDGGRQVEVNALGEEVQVIGQKSPVPGKGLGLTLDANLQRAAEEALAAWIAGVKTRGEPATGGCAVVLDVKTGGVLALVSNPAFDPNLFAGGITAGAWNRLINDPGYPLTNKAIQNTYPPGSVFKIITAAAALDSGATTPDELFVDRGVYVLNGWNFYGWETKGLGTLKLAEAICWSSDPVFYELGRRLGADKLAGYALTFGLGGKTGIGLPGEAAGTVPTESWKMLNYGEEWYPGETLIAAIGQGYYLVTPLQQALLLMIVANGGVAYRPFLVNKVLTPDGQVEKNIEPEVLRTVYLRPETWATIKQGLSLVVSQGTAAAAFQGFKPVVAGKTGSAETGRGTVHAWFACYAPAEAPEIAVAVLVEEGGEGSVSAAPVARQILETYFNMKTAAGVKK